MATKGCLPISTRPISDQKKCRRSWLITYDDSPEIREHVRFAHVHPWELQYGMNNFRQRNAKKGAELLISNHPLQCATPNGIIPHACGDSR